MTFCLKGWRVPAVICLLAAGLLIGPYSHAGCGDYLGQILINSFGWRFVEKQMVADVSEPKPIEPAIPVPKFYLFNKDLGPFSGSHITSPTSILNTLAQPKNLFFVGNKVGYMKTDAAGDWIVFDALSSTGYSYRLDNPNLKITDIHEMEKTDIVLITAKDKDNFHGIFYDTLTQRDDHRFNLDLSTLRKDGGYVNAVFYPYDVKAIAKVSNGFGKQMYHLNGFHGPTSLGAEIKIPGHPDMIRGVHKDEIIIEHGYQSISGVTHDGTVRWSVPIEPHHLVDRVEVARNHIFVLSSHYTHDLYIYKYPSGEPVLKVDIRDEVIMDFAVSNADKGDLAIVTKNRIYQVPDIDQLLGERYDIMIKTINEILGKG